MPPLDAPPAPAALADVDVKATDQGRLHGQFFLILAGHADAAQRPLAVRARGRQRGGVDLVDVRRWTSMRAAAIRRAGLAARSVGLRDPRAARKGRGLAIDGASRGVEFVFQLLVFTAQPLPFGFRPLQIVFQLPDAARLVVDDLLWVSRRRRLVALWHAAVMPNLRSKYKWKVRARAY